MTNVNVNSYYTAGGIAYLNSNGRIETTVNITASGNYTLVIGAGGNAAAGVLPQIGITVDGVTRTNFFLTTTNLASYTVVLSLTSGTHALGMAFLNDYYAPPEDRNAFFSQFTITPAPALRISSLNLDSAQRAAIFQWESTPGTACEVQITGLLSPMIWQPLITITSSASITGWTDDGALSGTPPLSPAALQRFYRIRQVSQ